MPCDGEVLEGIARHRRIRHHRRIRPVIRESGGDFSSVTGGTRVLSDWVVARVTADPGETFLDRMIAMVEGAARQNPNEVALTILLLALTIGVLLATVTCCRFRTIAPRPRARANPPLAVLIALLVCLIPTTIGGCCRRLAWRA